MGGGWVGKAHFFRGGVGLRGGGTRDSLNLITQFQILGKEMPRGRFRLRRGGICNVYVSLSPLRGKNSTIIIS